MKILITSDVHRDDQRLRRIINKHPDVDYHLDAGDLCFEPTAFPHLISVKGNGDYASRLPLIRMLDFGIKIMLVHGHREQVKFGLSVLKEKAKQAQVDLCIFGHTHERYLMAEGKTLYINPGALGDYQHSYAIYDYGSVSFYTDDRK